MVVYVVLFVIKLKFASATSKLASAALPPLEPVTGCLPTRLDGEKNPIWPELATKTSNEIEVKDPFNSRSDGGFNVNIVVPVLYVTPGTPPKAPA